MSANFPRNQHPDSTHTGGHGAFCNGYGTGSLGHLKMV